MKVLHINCVYKKGSTGKIIYDLEQYNDINGVETLVLYGIGDKHISKNSKKILNSFLLKINTLYTYLSGYMYKGSMMATLKTIKYIKKQKPNIVHLHSINGHMVNIYYLLNYLKKNRIPTVVTNHGEFFYTGSFTHVPDKSNQYLTGEKENIVNAKKLTNSLFFDKTHQAIQKMKKSFDGFEKLVITSVSPWVTSRSKHSFVLKNYEHITVLNGIDTKNVFYPREYQELKKELGTKEEKIILHVTSGFDNPLKGGKYMVELANTLLNQNYVIIFVGLDDKVNLPSNCINVGKVYDQNKLAEFYSLADVTVITSKKETFNMIVAESLSCGTPVVGFKAGGPETIAIDKYCDFVDFGDVEALKEKVIEKSNAKYQDIYLEAHKKYDKDIMARKYIEVYKDLLKV